MATYRAQEARERAALTGSIRQQLAIDTTTCTDECYKARIEGREPVPTADVGRRLAAAIYALLDGMTLSQLRAAQGALKID